MQDIKLSICIATFRRGAFIAQTLDSIISQIQPYVEIVVVDGASPDNTSEVLNPYVAKYPFITYHRETENSGVDADYDKCVSYAKGEYCWLMPDDDLMLDGAIKAILDKCDDSNDLVIVNSSVRDNSLLTTYNSSLLTITADKTYYAVTINEFYSDCIRYLSFIGGVIVKRSFWLNRDRKTYYGSAFIHVGVLLQKPAPNKVSVIAQPFIAIRYGNAMWRPQTFNIWMHNWPKLIQSFTHLPNHVSSQITQNSFLKTIKNLIIFRAQGYYGHKEYKEVTATSSLISKLIKYIISITPIYLVNATLALGLLLFKPTSKMLIYDLASSRYSTKISQFVAKKLGV